MRYRSGSQIREDFLRFFESKNHRRVHSSSLVPHNDPTLLFTNAGMNQFKNIFLGAESRAYARATTSQRCVRAGGKHNDLENVGFTRRHHTFFEMLGNFSFGDYFKLEAIVFAWELLTSDEWFGIDAARLYVTIFEGNQHVPRDNEAELIWIQTGVPKDRIFAMSAKDNFWQMGETGPCGPSSEIFYDLGVEASESGDDKPFPHDEQRYVEIWNLVFMRFDRSVTPEGPRLTPLPRPSIDTGMGLERVACVLQGVLSNYQTDLFTPLIARAAILTQFPLTGSPGVPSDGGSPTAETLHEAALSDAKGFASLRIIADHARAATFLIADGVLPANEGRGYVLRKILRRAIRHGRLLGQETPFLHHMVDAVRDEMHAAYPELNDAVSRVSQVVLNEEHQFARVIAQAARELDTMFLSAMSAAIEHMYTADRAGLERAFDLSNSALDSESPTFAEAWKEYTDDPGERSVRLVYSPIANHFPEAHWARFAGHEGFYLYETYGLPFDFIVDAARDARIVFDTEGFEVAKEEEQARARASWKGGSQKSVNPLYQALAKTEFEGYSAHRLDGARVLALVKNGAGVTHLEPGDEGEIVLDATSFYADSGGQVGDIGVLYGSDHHTAVAEVRGAVRPVPGVIVHKVLAWQTLAVGDEVDTAVNPEYRAATERNHTGTHLLHAALRQVLGKHVKQAGSLVNPSRLRFDFSHFAGVSEAELQEIEDIVNREVLANAHVETLVDVPIDVAVRELGAMALFGEKYGDRVRVVRIGDFSTELCGGTHTRATGEIGLIKLLGESSVASGVRRLEAVSGTGALHEFRRDFEVARVAGHFTGGSEQTPAEALRNRLSAADEELKKLRRELDQARMKAANTSVGDSVGSAVEVQGIKVLAQRVDGLDKGQMRTLVDSLRGKLGSGVVVLGAVVEDKVTLIAGVTKDLTARIQAGKLIGQLAAQVGGKGGGRPDLAEAGGTNPAALDATLQGAPGVVASLLG